MQAKRVTFPGWLLPAALLAPQLAITVVFFLWPAAQALWSSLKRDDPFGLRSEFAGTDNFAQLFADSAYADAMKTTLVFSPAVAILALALGLVLALLVDQAGRAGPIYTTVLVWPYAVAPAVGAILWAFLFDPAVGPLARGLGRIGIGWNHHLEGWQAMALVVLASAWKQVSYNLLFFLAGLAAIPRSLIEAASIDAAGPFRRAWTIILPLLAPTTFFLLVVNLLYAFFDTFGVIHAITSGGPGNSTTTLVYKVFRDGFIGLDLGGSAAQSVVLLLLVSVLTVIQFRYVERRVHYG